MARLKELEVFNQKRLGPRLKELIRRNGLERFDGLAVALSCGIWPSQGHLTMSGDITDKSLEFFLLYLIAKHYDHCNKI